MVGDDDAMLAGRGAMPASRLWRPHRRGGVEPFGVDVDWNNVPNPGLD